MLADWTKVLPYFIIQWYARTRCEVFTIMGREYVQVYKDTFTTKSP